MSESGVLLRDIKRIVCLPTPSDSPTPTGSPTVSSPELTCDTLEVALTPTRQGLSLQDGPTSDASHKSTGVTHTSDQSGVP